MKAPGEILGEPWEQGARSEAGIARIGARQMPESDNNRKILEQSSAHSHREIVLRVSPKAARPSEDQLAFLWIDESTTGLSRNPTGKGEVRCQN